MLWDDKQQCLVNMPRQTMPTDYQLYGIPRWVKMIVFHTLLAIFCAPLYWLVPYTFAMHGVQWHYKYALWVLGAAIVIYITGWLFLKQYLSRAPHY